MNNIEVYRGSYAKTLLNETILIQKELSDKVLGACFSVHNILGPGLLESAYVGALVIEFSRLGISFERQKVFPVYYKGELAGGYSAEYPIWILYTALILAPQNEILNTDVQNSLCRFGYRGYNYSRVKIGSMPYKGYVRLH